jgi:hypothetical protein
MIFLFEALPEQGVRRYFLQVKKLTFKRAPGSQYALPTQSQVHSPAVFKKYRQLFRLQL